MPKQIHRVEGVKPSPLLSHVVEANGFVFLAGTVGDDPATGTVRAGGYFFLPSLSASRVQKLFD